MLCAKSRLLYDTPETESNAKINSHLVRECGVVVREAQITGRQPAVLYSAFSTLSLNLQHTALDINDQGQTRIRNIVCNKSFRDIQDDLYQLILTTSQPSPTTKLRGSLQLSEFKRPPQEIPVHLQKTQRKTHPMPYSPSHHDPKPTTSHHAPS